MSEVRGMRKTRVGVVVSDKMDKTITIAVKYRVRHPLYGKIMNRTTKIKAHYCTFKSCVCSDIVTA